MKKVLLLMVCALMGYALYAQVSDNFSDYTVGGKLAQQAQGLGKTYWTTWSEAPGGAEDGVIAEVEGNKVAKFTWDNDQVLKLGKKSSGVWNLSMKMYVPTGTCGYFNTIADFHPENPNITIWAIQVYLGCKGEGTHPLTPGVGTMHIAGSNTVGFTFEHNAWTDIKIHIDLDDDYAEIYINGVSLFAWTYSDGTFGEGCPKVIDVMDIFPPVSGSNFFVDDVVFEATTPLPQPILSVTPDDELVIKLPPNAAKDGTFYVVSEEENTRQAVWSTYVDYSPLETGTGSDFPLMVCDVYSIGTSSFGGTTAVSAEICMKLQPTDYKDKLGGMLKQVAFYVQDVELQGGGSSIPDSDLTFRVYDQGPAMNIPGNLLAEKVLPKASLILNDWNWVTLPTPVQLTGGEYWVTVEMFHEAGNYPMTTADVGHETYGGDWWRIGDGAWKKVGENNSTYYNWAIQAKGDGKVSKMWGIPDKSYGTTLSASQTPVKVTANSQGFAEGTYTANIVVIGNLPGYPSFDIPLTMVVDNEELNTNTNVTSVTVDGTIAPKDESGQYDYRLEGFKTDKGTAEIVVTTEDPKATVTGDIGEQPIKNGANNYTFTVTAEDGTTTREYTLRVMAEIVVHAISEIDNAVQLYPNPVVDYLYLKSDVAIERVTIYNLTGKVVKQIEQPGLSIDLSDFASGIYMLRVSSSQGETVKKFIKE